MPEYIDIDAQVVVTDTRGRELETTVRHIFEMNKGVYTAADVKPVVWGKWVLWMRIPEDYICDKCEWHSRIKTNFCPNCGADMREES